VSSLIDEELPWGQLLASTLMLHRSFKIKR